MAKDDDNSGGGSGSSERREARDDRNDDRGESRREGRRGPSDEGRGVANKLLRKFRGRAEDALAELADENKELRIDRRELRADLEKFKKPGVIVLEGDDAKAYTELKALGAPADVKKKVEEHGTLAARLAEHDTRVQANEAATVLGWDPTATAAAIVDKRLAVSFVDGKDAAGKAVKVPHVKPIGADDKVAAVPLTDYVNANAAYLMPALTAKNGTPAKAPPAGGSSSTQRATGTQMVEQSAGGSSTATNGTDNAQRATVPGRPKYMTPGQRNQSATK